MEKNNTLAVPIAIVLSAIIIAGAIFFVNRTPGTPGAQPVAVYSEPAPITEEDHILGNPNAELIYVEYSDFECPVCAFFHPMMEDLLTEFGTSGRVAWVYRHFPLPLPGHQNAPKIAEGSECAAELGGNDAFWEYTNAIFTQDVNNEPTSIPDVPFAIAADIGLDVVAFEQCYESGKYLSRVESDFNDAGETGGSGTPLTFMLLKNPLTKEQKTDILLFLNQLRVDRNFFAFPEDGNMIVFSGVLQNEQIMRTLLQGTTQIILGLPVGNAPSTTESNTGDTATTTDTE